MNSIELILYIITIVVLLTISAIFSGTETAMTAVSKARLIQLSKNGNIRAAAVISLLDKTENLIGSLLIGNNFINILASAIATSFFMTIFGDAGVVMATLIMTVLVVTFAEVLPKVYALSNPDKVSMSMIVITSKMMTLLRPLNAGVISIVNLILKILDIRKRKDTAEEQEEELRGAIELHDGDDPDYKQEREMLRSIMDLDDTTIEQSFTHRNNVVTIDINDPTEKIINLVLSSTFSKFPVIDGAENIIGVLLEKELMIHLIKSKKNNKELKIRKAIREAWYVPDSTSMLNQLQAFRGKGVHFAIVIDEYGTYMGVITITNILEHIVGDVDYQEHTFNIHKLPDNSYIFDGDDLIRNINRELDWNLPDESASTIAGLILHECQTLPKEGQMFSFYGYDFIVAKRHRQQITKVRIKTIN